MPKDKIIYQNLLDIGIFILFLELILKENDINYNKIIHDDNELDEEELVLNAIFGLGDINV